MNINIAFKLIFYYAQVKKFTVNFSHYNLIFIPPSVCTTVKDFIFTIAPHEYINIKKKKKRKVIFKRLITEQLFWLP